MAPLNIENLPDRPYEKLKARAKLDRRPVAREVIYLLSAALDGAPASSIMDLQGLGKELWQGVDATAYVASERDAED